MTWAYCGICGVWKVCLKLGAEGEWPRFVCQDCYLSHIVSPEARTFMRRLADWMKRRR